MSGLERLCWRATPILLGAMGVLILVVDVLTWRAL
jgi:hypothetical protein